MTTVVCASWFAPMSVDACRYGGVWRELPAVNRDKSLDTPTSVGGNIRDASHAGRTPNPILDVGRPG